jgi:hypothetical protein
MRISSAIVAVAALASPAFADEPALTSTEVQAELRPAGDEIEHCYTDRTPGMRGAGHLDLVMTVSRIGIVERLEIKTPGLSARVAKDIASCVRSAVATISFPMRKAWTTATVPYFFQRTYAPNAGPQLSCWNPNGCHVKHEPSETWSSGPSQAGNRSRTRSP